MANAYPPTGYQRGRPRKGEMRPISPNAVKSAEWRAKQIAENPEQYRLHQALYQQLWRLVNEERYKEIKRNATARARAWKNAQVRVSGKAI